VSKKIIAGREVDQERSAAIKARVHVWSRTPETQRNPGSISQLAIQLGVSRPYVSRLVAKLQNVPIPVIVTPETTAAPETITPVSTPTHTGTPQSLIESGDLQAIAAHTDITRKIAELAKSGDTKAARLYFEHIAGPYRADGQSKREPVPPVVIAALGWLPAAAKTPVNNSQLPDAAQVIESTMLESGELVSSKES
jgi:hypothetical protein